jgi:hypothetical protein
MMPFQRRRHTVLTTLVLLSMLGGCGDGMKTYPVRGTVTLPNGQPLAGGTVSMEAVDQTVSGMAQTDAQGRFAMSTLEVGDGLPPGNYRALVQPPGSLDPDQPAPMPFNPKYTRYETSGLEFTIEGSVDDLKIQLR